MPLRLPRKRARRSSRVSKSEPGQHWRHDRLRLFQREFHSCAAFILDNNQRPIRLSWQSPRHCHQPRCLCRGDARPFDKGHGAANRRSLGVLTATLAFAAVWPTWREDKRRVSNGEHTGAANFSVTPENEHHYRDEMEQAYHLRHRVFIEQKGWRPT